MVLCDKDIRKLCLAPLYFNQRPLIEPFVQFWPYTEEQLPEGTISYGLSSSGYDIRLGTEILVLKNTYGETLNPKKFKDPAYAARMFDRRIFKEGDEIVIPPSGYILGSTVEYFRIPNHIVVVCLGKSTYSRCAVTINVTPLESDWEGNLTVEISNDGPGNVSVFAGEGIAQLMFHVLSDIPEATYADKKGKYQGQRGVTPAVVK